MDGRAVLNKMRKVIITIGELNGVHIRTTSFNPRFLALMLSAKTNHVHATGKSNVRVLDLVIPNLMAYHQGRIAEVLHAADGLATQARDLIAGLESWRAAFSDAIGSGVASLESKPWYSVNSG